MNEKVAWPCVALCLVALSLPTRAATTLQDIIRRTLETHPEVLIREGETRTGQHSLREARAGYFPSLDLSLGRGRETSENPTTRLREIEGDISLNRREASLRLSQMLFDGFRTPARVAGQRAELQAARERRRQTAESVAFQAADASLELFRRRELLELAKDHLVVHQKTLEQIRKLVESGAGRRADLQHTEGREALAKATLVRAEGEARDAETHFRRVVGSPPPPDLLNPLRTLSLPEPADSLESLLTQTLDQHPALVAARAEIEAARAELRQTRSAFLPRLDLELKASRNKNLDGQPGESNDLQAMLNLRYNLYRGGADQARREAAAERLGIARERLKLRHREIEEEIRRAWNALLTARERLAFLQAHRDSGAEVLASYKQQFKLGRRNLLDVLDSENELYQARLNLATGQYLVLLARLRLLASRGLLLETLGLENSERQTEKNLPESADERQ